MMLDQLLNIAIREGCFQPSRVKPLRSHIKRYAGWLGTEPAACLPALYHLPKDRRDELINSAPGDFSPAYRKNIKNDIDNLLEIGVARGWLPPLAAPLKDWRTKGNSRTFEKTYYHRLGGADRTPYALGKQGLTRRTRGEPVPEQSPPGFSELAPQLHAELEAYLSSCLDQFDQRTPHFIKKRPVTCNAVRNVVERLAGYAVYELELPAELLDLRELCRPTLLQAFIPWWLRRRKRSTGGLRVFLRTMRTIAEPHLHDLALAQAIAALYDMPGLPPEEPMSDAEPPWLDLEELDLVGQSRHPLNERRLQDAPYAQEVAYYLAHPHGRPAQAYQQHPQGSNLKLMAVWAQHSRMLRLWVHRPLRQRNMRELGLFQGTWRGVLVNQNLVPQADGTYRIHFEGAELKKGYRRAGRHQRRINKWDELFPRSLLPQLQEWLTLWRPRLIPDPSYPYVFIGRWGEPYDTPSMSRLVERTVWTFTQDRPGGPVAINPHAIRSFWVTQMTIAGLDFATLTRIFGDSVSVTWERYLKVDKSRQISQWTRDLAKAIADGTD
jgi:hypothetical protein